MTSTSSSPSLTAAAPPQATPWWRVGVVWLVIGGPLSVVLASVASAILAWQAIDPVLQLDDVAATQAAKADPKSALAPALKGRNHAASPTRD